MSNAEDRGQKLSPEEIEDQTTKSCCSNKAVQPQDTEGSCCSGDSAVQENETSCCSSDHDSSEDDCCSSAREHEHTHIHAHTGCGCSSQSEAAIPDVTNWKGARSFRVEGLCCAEEMGILRRVVGPVVGDPEYLAFDVLNGKMIVSPVARDVADEKIIKAVDTTGMKAALFIEQEAADARAKQHRRLGTFTVASGLFWAIALVVQAVLFFSSTNSTDVFSVFQSVPSGPVEVLYMLAIVAGLRLVAPKGWYALKTLRPDMNLLMLVAVAGAIGIGEWFEGATVAFLFSLSLYLESWSVGRARKAVAALMDIAPTVVRLLKPNGSEEDVPANSVKPGATFVVRGGDRIPLDGVVRKGVGSVDQAPITGESMPVMKEAGDDVYAGTINGEGSFEVEATKGADDTMLARIIRMVSEAQARRAAAEQWVEKFARVYTPAVMVLAILLATIPPLLFGAAWMDWFYRALVLLVIACPCALVISTPVSIVAGLTSAARNGVLIKGGVFLELPARLKALAFDKTGTITNGLPTVTDVYPLSGHSVEELLTRAASLEARSSHPLAEAILTRAKEDGVEYQAAENVELLPGRGLSGQRNGKSYWLGSRRFLNEKDFEIGEADAKARELEAEGKTVVAVGTDAHVCGLIALADTVRDTAEELVSQLHKAGVEKLVMLTGDNKATAERVASSVGIDEVRAELLPEDKVAAVEQLSHEYETVAMIGDGVNDAPAMARASFGIAMGAIGSDAAIETADIALMKDDLSRLPWLIHHSKRTLQIIHQNIAFAFIVKGILVVLTAMGFASLWAAILGDVGATLIVVTNALRLLKDKA
ncbi:MULTISPECIES: cation-translocating P-type ATPase [unclassified Pseudovibrio]|uniref:heavy metal translocating P-type ATPase n=1 Tax=unclassified Pseudovibrio TaxID=2627060 RepID=UPI0007B1AB85|nr:MULTISPECIES: cation-translocating P-type ATPase [unclassified Pseudovibrio]KZK99733.1 putative cadmium-transporting ATPase [Pseudovibrio sp. W74]KZL11965.1 putative cadmium-transporting ATPase [Pseudovibrio sp. Ad14]